MERKLKIGLFGFGCVGQGLHDIFTKTDSINAEIVKICVKDKAKKRSLPMDYFTFEKEDLLNDPEVNTIVEVIDTADEAFEIVKTAMEGGKSVVTANKKMVAENFKELVDLQLKHNVSLLYEASSCASIPVIRNLEEYYDNDMLTAFEGIFNGSSNYILSKMVNEGKGYDEVLKQAQEIGYAESDPTLDVGGHDAKYKLCILTAHAFGVYVDPEEIFTYGIQTINDHDLKFAMEKRLKIKLFASSQIINGKLATWVMPQFCDDRFKLYNVENEYNGVVLEGAFSDAQQLIGKGAGSHATGSAVASDISALAYNYRYEYKKLQRPNRPERTNDFIIEVYIRYENKEDISDLKFESVDQVYESSTFKYLVGKIKLSSLVNQTILSNPNCFIAQTEVPARVLN